MSISVRFDASRVFDAGDLIGKSLIAKQKVTLINSVGNPIGTVPAGQSIGIVYSWLDPKPGVRNALWWAFMQNGIMYYVVHQQDLFDVSSIKMQGVLSLDEKNKAAIDQAKEDAKGPLQKTLDAIISPITNSLGTGVSNIIKPILPIAVIAIVGWVVFKKVK